MPNKNIAVITEDVRRNLIAAFLFGKSKKQIEKLYSSRPIVKIKNPFAERHNIIAKVKVKSKKYKEEPSFLTVLLLFNTNVHADNNPSNIAFMNNTLDNPN
ncbi:MAG: hypothetical protein LBT03_01030 [Holosporales bacterium]|jgi:hypothetical protein|nr:hypothetical protein [Holosporales bacterium]